MIPLPMLLCDARNEGNKRKHAGSEPGKPAAGPEARGLRKGHEMFLVPCRLFVSPAKDAAVLQVQH
jgi:hypothetical protein